MKKLLTTIAAAIFILPLMAGQEGKHSSEQAASRLEYLSIVLDLTEVQNAEIRGLQAEHMATVTGIKDAYKPIMDDMKDELKNIRLENLEGDGSFESSREKAEAVRAKYDSQLAPMRDALDTEKDAFSEKLKSLLDTDQREKFDQLTAWKEKNRPEMQHRGHKHDNPGLHKGWDNGEPRGQHKGWGKERQGNTAPGHHHREPPGNGDKK